MWHTQAAMRLAAVAGVEPNLGEIQEREASHTLRVRTALALPRLDKRGLHAS